MWFERPVVECRDGIPKTLDSIPDRARYFFTACYKMLFHSLVLRATEIQV